MKISQSLISIALTLFMLQGCEGGSSLLDPDKDFDPLIPETPVDDGSDDPRPPDFAPVISTDEHQIFNVDGEPVLLRGINLQYADDEFIRFDGILGVRGAGSNVIRMQLSPETTAMELEVALERTMNMGMVAVLMLDDPATIACKENDIALDEAVQSLWFDEWLPIIAQERFQPYLMINIANKWGPRGVWDAASRSYSEYMDSYKSYIRQFRKAGFKVPLVIDAADCGSDFNVFLGGRAKELLAADSESNLVMSVHAYGGNWNSYRKVRDATNLLYQEKVPFILSDFGGSGFGGDAAINHLDILNLGAGDKALVLDLPWNGIENKAAFVRNLSPAVNLLGATVSLDVFVPSSYVKDGNLLLDVYVKDGDWAFASFGGEAVATLKGNAWNRLKYTVGSVADIKGWVAEGFNPAVIQQLGVQLTANGKPASVNGAIKIDNVTITLGGGPQPELNSTFSGTNDGWTRNYGDSAEITVDSGALSFAPAWTAEQGKIALTTSGGGINFEQPLILIANVCFPAAYQNEAGLNMQFFTQWNGAAGDWQWTSLGQVNVGEMPFGGCGELRVNTSGLIVDPIQIYTFGFEIGGISAAAASIVEPIRVDSIWVGTQEQLAGPQGAMYAANFSEGLNGWSNYLDWGSASGEVSHSEGALLIVPDWSTSGQIVLGSNEIQQSTEMDLTGDYSLKVDVFLPEGTEATNFYFKLMIQDGNWVAAETASIGFDQFVPGQWNTIELTVPEANYGEGFDRTTVPKVFVVFLGGLTNTPGGVLFDNFEVVGPVESDTAEVVVDLDFGELEQVQSFAFDFADGGFTEEGMTGVLSQDYGGMPFGWIAWSWKGNQGDAAVLDISLEEGVVMDASDPTDVSKWLIYLTDRGGDIVLGPNGIVETSVPAFTAEEPAP